MSSKGSQVVTGTWIQSTRRGWHFMVEQQRSSLGWVGSEDMNVGFLGWLLLSTGCALHSSSVTVSTQDAWLSEDPGAQCLTHLDLHEALCPGS